MCVRQIRLTSELNNNTGIEIPKTVLNVANKFCQ